MNTYTLLYKYIVAHPLNILDNGHQYDQYVWLTVVKTNNVTMPTQYFIRCVNDTSIIAVIAELINSDQSVNHVACYWFYDG